MPMVAPMASPNCGSPLDGYRRIYDYTDQSIDTQHHRRLVEPTHYNRYWKVVEDPELGGYTLRLVLINLDYTLRHFPNHHGALYAILRLEYNQGALPQGVGPGSGEPRRSRGVRRHRAPVRGRPRGAVAQDLSSRRGGHAAGLSRQHAHLHLRGLRHRRLRLRHRALSAPTQPCDFAHQPTALVR